MWISGLFVCFISQKIARKLRFWRKTGSCFGIGLITRTLMDRKSCSTLPDKMVTFTSIFFPPTVQKTPKCFSFYRTPPANTELLFTIDPPWRCQNVGKLLCYSLYDSRRRQNSLQFPENVCSAGLNPDTPLLETCSDGSNSLCKVSTCDWLSWVTWWREQECIGILYHVQTKVMVFWWHGVSVSYVNMFQRE